MKTKLTLLIALFAAAAISAQAQTSVPTPRSVAPNYTPPQSTAPMQTTYTYQNPHANTWDFYLTTGAWFFERATMGAHHILYERVHGGPDIYATGKLKLNMKDSAFFGFGVGYNVTEQLSVHVQFAYANPDYTATFDGQTITGGPSTPVHDTVRFDADISTGDIGIRYDFLTGKFRPFVQASLGFMYIDTGIPNGPYYYWWDWYWGGYYGDAPTVDHTYFTLGATIGANYYFTKNVFGQLSYTSNWANMPQSWMHNQRINVSVGVNY